jgi:thymidylate synthase
MTDYISDNIDNIFKFICKKIITDGVNIQDTKELNNFSFALTNLNNNVINIRDISKAYLCGELTWYFLKRNDIEFINYFSSSNNRISDDGVFCYSAYGDIVFKRHNFDQVEKIIELLLVDPNSRRAVINFNVPNKYVIETKDEICTIALQFYIRNNVLNCTAVMRSNDLWNCLPYDVVFFTELQKYIAHRLNIDVGIYYHNVISLHCYDKDINNIKEIENKIRTEFISIDIEKLNLFKKFIEFNVVNSNDKQQKIIDLCKSLKILNIKEEK